MVPLTNNCESLLVLIRLVRTARLSCRLSAPTAMTYRLKNSSHAITSPALPTMTGGVRYLPQISIIVARLPARPTTSTNTRSGGLPITAFLSRGPSMAKRSCDRTTGIVLRGTESLLTHRWRGESGANQSLKWDFLGRELRLDSKTFMDDVGSVRALFGAWIDQISLCPSWLLPPHVVLSR